MIIDIEEGLIDLERELVKTFGVDPSVFATDEGKRMLVEISMSFLRHSYLQYIMNDGMSDGKVMTEIASALYKAGQHAAFTKVKEMAALLLRYEASGDNPDMDDGPEGQAVFEAGEFFEEALREIEDIVMEIMRKDTEHQVYQFRFVTGPAGFKMIKADCVIAQSDAVRFACGNRKQYTDIISNIILSNS